MNQGQQLSREQINHFTNKILQAALTVHSKLGPGLMEKTYEACLIYELNKMGLRTSSQVELPVHYDEIEISLGYRVDLIVQDCVLVELKSTQRITSLHEAQLLTYLKLSKIKLGLLINFNVVRLRDGIKRLVNNF